MSAFFDLSRDGRKLTGSLAARGAVLDQRCDGRGRCGRCRVRLLSGIWRIEGKPCTIETPRDALACRCELVSESGRVEVPASSLAETAGHALASWSGAPLPATGETVIGIDLGTTTVAAAKLRNGAIMAEAGAFNRQNRYGDNVISRIVHAGGSADGLAELQRAAVETINELLRSLGTEEVARIAVAGNTVMSLLLHGIDPSPVGVSPFRPPCRRFPVRPASELGLAAPPETPVLTFPCISGYLGGDILAGWCETDLQPGDMVADLGTNCEILFRTANGLFGATAAAGPAFEGASIECGCRAVPGAVAHIAPDGAAEVIGGGEARGVCGSGMVDFLAVWRAAGRLNECGRLVPPAPFAEIAPGVRLTERDIEQLLKAKAAIAAGIRTLEEHCGERAARLRLAGGFARYLDPAAAVRIGMLPERPCDRVGNTSLAGALRLAADPAWLTELETRIDEPRELPLNAEPGFEDAYIDGLMLP